MYYLLFKFQNTNTQKSSSTHRIYKKVCILRGGRKFSGYLSIIKMFNFFFFFFFFFFNFYFTYFLFLSLNYLMYFFFKM